MEAKPFVIRAWLPLIICCPLATGGVAGELEQSFSEQVEVAEVLLDVLVTDRHGQVVIGLGANDFRVTEDGEPVEITGLTFYSSRVLLTPPEALERSGLRIDQVVEDRYFILFFQQQRRTAGEVPGLLARQLDAAGEVEQWIREDLQVADWVAVLSYDSRLRVLQDFSRNPEALTVAVREAARGGGGSGDWPSRRPAPESAPSLVAQLSGNKELARQTADIHQALQLVAIATGTLPGRKNLLFFGRGIGEIDGFGGWRPDSRYWQPMIDTLNHHNIAVYPIDLMPSNVRHSLENSLALLATSTGGSFTRQFTSFGSRLEDISRENGGYYLLSYTSRHRVGTDGFQKVKVEAANPELRLRARQGYLYGD